MTASEIFEHPEYYNVHFKFPNEFWTDLKLKGFSNYVQSNCYRVKNIQSCFIVRPSEQVNRKTLRYRIRNNDGKMQSFSANKLFENFDVTTAFDVNNGTGFIYGAF